MAIASQPRAQAVPDAHPDLPIKGWSTVPYFAKETVGVGIGRIIGFDNLSRLHVDL